MPPPAPAPVFAAKPINLPWHQAEAYWICAKPKGGSHAAKALMLAGMKERNGWFMLQAPRRWASSWQQVRAALESADAWEEAEIAIVPGAAAPDASARGTLPAEQAEALADSLWLGDALLESRIHCYLQPVMTAHQKTFGYESFARVRNADGSVTAGEAIVRASKALGIEYAIDRLLHIEAIRTFASGAFTGAIFINFFPGFIQRPEVYLEGLSETVRAHGIVPKHIVLDFTQCEAPHDIQHLKRVTEYCRTRGFAIALDDLETVAQAKTLMREIRPDYVKLDMSLAQGLSNSNCRETVRQLVELCHADGVTVIAEGVETEAAFQTFKEAGVDLFQGYYFSPPVPVETVAGKESA